jgi:pyrroline-5-carboxylate reductase
MPTIGFIGAGNMAEAIARGLIRSALYRPNEIRATDPNPDRQKLFVDDLGIPCTAEGASCIETAPKSDVVVLATKPFVMSDVLKQLAPKLKPDVLIISIAAGISCKFIEETVAAGGGAVNKPRVIRVMPNTPMLAGKGMSALARGTHATEADLITAERIFASAGKTVRVAETEMDAVTAVSGSGPAYIFFLAEALTEAAKAAGLNEAQAITLARETVIGAAVLLDQSKDSATELRRKVTTPNGTTQAAIETMQAGGFTELMTKAVAAAAKRSRELGK